MFLVCFFFKPRFGNCFKGAPFTSTALGCCRCCTLLHPLPIYLTPGLHDFDSKQEEKKLEFLEHFYHHLLQEKIYFLQV